MLNAGAAVIIACRNQKKAEEAVKTLKEETKNGKVSVIIVFFSFTISTSLLMFLIPIP